MRKNFSKLKEKQVSKGYLSQNDSVDETIYFITWLGFLAVTCEGFKNLNFRILLSSNRPKEFEELIPYSDEIGRKIKIHSDSLRKLRNDVFHLRKDTNTFESFLSEKGGEYNGQRNYTIEFLSSSQSIEYFVNFTTSLTTAVQRVKF